MSGNGFSNNINDVRVELSQGISKRKGITIKNDLQSQSTPTCIVTSTSLNSITCSSLTGLVVGDLFAYIINYGGKSNNILIANILGLYFF